MAALKWFLYSMHPAVYALEVNLGVNSTKYNMKMDNNLINEIKKRLWDLIDPNDTTADRVDCVSETMQAI